jgi:hypothetical protein
MGEKKCIHNCLENLKGKDHMKVLRIDGRIILKWIIHKESGKVWTGFI